MTIMISLISILGVVTGFILGLVAVAISRIGKALPCIVFCAGNLLAIIGLLVLLADIGWLSLPIEFDFIYVVAMTTLATYYFYRKTLVWHWHKNKPAIYILNNFNPMPSEKLRR